MVEGDKSEVKVIVRESELRKRRAGTWAAIIGTGAVLLEGAQLVQGNASIWNNVAFLGAVLAILYGFMLSWDGPNHAFGVAGGGLGVVLLAKIFIWPSINSRFAGVNESLPEFLSVEGILMAVLILISLYLVLIRGDVRRVDKHS